MIRWEEQKGETPEGFWEVVLDLASALCYSALLAVVIWVLAVVFFIL